MGDEARLEAHMAKAQTAYETAFGEAQDLSGWETIRSKKNFFASKKIMRGGLAALKVDAYIPMSPSEVVSRTFGHFAEYTQEFLPDIYDSEVIVKEFNRNARVVHSCTKPPAPGVGARDVVFFTVLLELDEQTFALVDTSVEAAEAPPQENYIRTDLHYALHIFERMEDEPQKTHLLLISLVDPKGILPAGLVNMTLGRRADFYEKVIDRISV